MNFNRLSWRFEMRKRRVHKISATSSIGERRSSERENESEIVQDEVHSVDAVSDSKLTITVSVKAYSDMKLCMITSRIYSTEKRPEYTDLLEHILDYLSPHYRDHEDVKIRFSVNDSDIEHSRNVDDIWDYIHRRPYNTKFEIVIDLPKFVSGSMSTISSKNAARLLRAVGIRAHTNIKILELSQMFGAGGSRIFEDLYLYHSNNKDIQSFRMSGYKSEESKEKNTEYFRLWLNKYWDINNLGDWHKLKQSENLDFKIRNSQLGERVQIRGKPDLGLFGGTAVAPLVYIEYTMENAAMRPGQKLTALYGATLIADFPILHLATDGLERWNFSFLKKREQDFNVVNVDIVVRKPSEYKIALGVIIAFVYNSLGVLKRKKFDDAIGSGPYPRNGSRGDNDQEEDESDERPDDFGRATSGDIEEKYGAFIISGNQTSYGDWDQDMKMDSGEESESNERAREVDAFKQVVTDKYMMASEGLDLNEDQRKILNKKLILKTIEEASAQYDEMNEMQMTEDEYIEWQEEQDDEIKKNFAESLLKPLGNGKNDGAAKIDHWIDKVSN